MKIFNGFDTKLDEKELLSSIEKYGEGKVILTKKHRVFLILPLALLFGSIGFFVLLVWFSRGQYINEKPRLFWIIASGQFLVTFLRIIHSIQTIWTTIQKHKGKVYFGSVSKKSLQAGKFEHYLTHSFISLILQVVLMLTDCILAIVFTEHGAKERLMFFGGLMLNLVFIYLIWMTINKVIDYEMRFNIFTPDHFFIHRQKSFFSPENISLPTNNIMLKYTTKGLGAILGYGKIIISREGGGEGTEPIKIAYVYKPRELINKINEIVKSK